MLVVHSFITSRRRSPQAVPHVFCACVLCVDSSCTYVRTQTGEGDTETERERERGKESKGEGGHKGNKAMTREKYIDTPGCIGVRLSAFA